MRSVTSRALLHPLWWSALMVLIVNDHVLKGSSVLHPALIGKLSDFAGLLVAPMLCAVLLRVRTRRAIVACHTVVGLGFVLLKSVASVASWVVRAAAALGMHWQIVCDPTDLWALPMLGVSLYVFARPAHQVEVLRANQRSVVGAGIALGLVATVATSMPPPEFAGAGRTAMGTLAVRSDHRLFLLDPSSGKTQARLQLGDDRFSANRDWVVFWPEHRGHLRAWNLRSGTLVWERQLPASECSASAGARHVLVTCPGQVRIWSWADGRELWRAEGELRGRLEEALLIEREGRQHVYEARTGHEYFSRPNGGDEPCLLPGGLYANTQGALLRFELHSGKVLARLQIEAANDSAISCPTSVRETELPEPGWAPDLLGVVDPMAPLVRARGQLVIAHDPVTLAELWRSTIPEQRGFLKDSCQVATKDIVVMRGGPWVFDARSGNLSGLGDRPRTQPPDHDPVILVEVHRPSHVRAYDARTGLVLWQRDLDDEH